MIRYVGLYWEFDVMWCHQLCRNLKPYTQYAIWGLSCKQKLLQFFSVCSNKSNVAVLSIFNHEMFEFMSQKCFILLSDCRVADWLEVIVLQWCVYTCCTVFTAHLVDCVDELDDWACNYYEYKGYCANSTYAVGKCLTRCRLGPIIIIIIN